MTVIAAQFAQGHSDHPYFSDYFSQVRTFSENDRMLVEGRTVAYEQMYKSVYRFLEAFSHPSFQGEWKRDALNRKHPSCIAAFSLSGEKFQSAMQAYQLARENLDRIVFDYQQLTRDMAWSYGLDERPIGESLHQALTASIQQSIHDLQSLSKEGNVPFSEDTALARVTALVTSLEEQLTTPIDEIFPKLKELAPKGEKTGHPEITL